MTLLLTLYCLCADEAEAATLGTALLGTLAGQLPGSQPSLQQPARRYWKTPEYFGFELQVAQVGAAGLRQLVASHPGNWWLADDEDRPEAVWNQGAGPPLLLQAVRWAQLLVTD